MFRAGEQAKRLFDTLAEATATVGLEAVLCGLSDWNDLVLLSRMIEGDEQSISETLEDKLNALVPSSVANEIAQM